MRQLKIVIADDSALIRAMLRQTFTRIQGLALEGEAEDGTQAVELVRQLKPDLVVLDLSMPLMDGIEVLEEIRKDNQSVVVVILTADGSPGVEGMCLEAGANFFLNKDEIVELVEICRLELLFKQLPG